MMTDEPVNQALVDRLQRNINDAEEEFKGFVVGRRLRNLIAAARKRRGEDVGEVREKPAFGEPDTQLAADQPTGDQGIDLGVMFAETSKKVKSFAAASENNTDEDASEDVEGQESAQDEASTDVPDGYQSAFDILDGLHKDGIT